MDKNRRVAFYALRDVEMKKSYSNLALNHQILFGKPESPAFVRELAYGVLKNKRYLDNIVDHYVPSGSGSVKPNDRIILRMGLYQLIYMNSVPEYAAVNESVKLAKRFSRGRQGFINGVLRAYLKNPYEAKLPDKSEDLIRHLSIKYSYEPWIIELWKNQYHMDFVEELLASGNKTPVVTLRVNSLRTSREEVREKLAQLGVETENSDMSPRALRVRSGSVLNNRLYENGFYAIQDEVSQIAVEKLAPEAGDFVIDVCAAPGGKTMAMAERMGNAGRILAMDIYKRKVNLLLKEADRLGITIVDARTWDATKVDSSLIEKADKVLVDAPCSGLGVLRKKPEIKYRKKTAELEALPRKQFEILSAASKYVKPGGMLMYATCTINPAENQRVVSEFLSKNPSFEKEDVVQLLPNVNDTDGFYICKMKKTKELY